MIAPNPATTASSQKGKILYPSFMPNRNIEPEAAVPIERAKQLKDAAAPLTVARRRGDGVVLVNLHVIRSW
jgi:hypothetical protein